MRAIQENYILIFFFLTNYIYHICICNTGCMHEHNMVVVKVSCVSSYSKRNSKVDSYVQFMHIHKFSPIHCALLMNRKQENFSSRCLSTSISVKLIKPQQLMTTHRNQPNWVNINKGKLVLQNDNESEAFYNTFVTSKRRQWYMQAAQVKCWTRVEV